MLLSLVLSILLISGRGQRILPPPSQVRIVDVIPKSLSGETNQDSEPSLAISRAGKGKWLAVTAFTPDPAGGDLAPIYISDDGGATWSLNCVIPGGGDVGTSDVTVGFGSGTDLYITDLRGKQPFGHVFLDVIKLNDFRSLDPYVDLRPGQMREQVDQPFVTVSSTTSSGVDTNRMFIGLNDFSAAQGHTATVDHSSQPFFRLEERSTPTQDGPEVRIATIDSGWTYAAFYRWIRRNDPRPDGNTRISGEVVVLRDNTFGNDPHPFSQLVGKDGKHGIPAASKLSLLWGYNIGSQRIGGSLAIAIDPRKPIDPKKPNVVYLAYGSDGGQDSTPYQLHLCQSTDGGKTWSEISGIKYTTNAVNASLAVTSDGILGFLYQSFDSTSQTWSTYLYRRSDTAADKEPLLLSRFSESTTPNIQDTQNHKFFHPYLGDYAALSTYENSFYGVFCASNQPRLANFPLVNDLHQVFARNFDPASGSMTDIHKHRIVDAKTNRPISGISIDPFFFRIDN